MVYISLTIAMVLAFILFKKIAGFAGNKLHRSFVSMGDFNGKTYTEFVRTCGRPTAIKKVGTGTLCTWHKGKYLVVLEFDSAGKFTAKRNEVLLK